MLKQSKMYLRKHIREVHEHTDKYKCDICGQTAKRIEAIKNHIMRLHVPKSPDFKCDQCGQE